MTKTSEQRQQEFNANVTKHARTIRAMRLLIASGQFEKQELADMLHALMGYVTQGEIWDLFAHLELGSYTREPLEA